MNEKKEVLSVLRNLWLNGDSPLHRIYSSWEELEGNVEFQPEGTQGKRKSRIRRCPSCDVKQEIRKPVEGIFPYQNCKSCKRAFYVNKDFTVRKLTKEEKRDIPNAWIQVVEDLSKKKTAIVFRLE